MERDVKNGRSALPPLPLALVSAGQRAMVVGVRGARETRRHLETLGFTEGSSVTVVSSSGGNLVVEVRGSQIALDRKIAMDVMAAG